MREKLIDLCKQANDELRLRCGCSTWGDFVDRLIANGVTVPDKNVGKWIPVSERLPEESGEYLACCGEYDGICVIYYENKWRTKWKEVTHWMPLPEPPKGE